MCAETDSGSERARIAYLCLQATRQGQASHAHVRGILSGLAELGWECDLFEPWYAEQPTPQKLLVRMREFARVQRRAVRAMSGYDALYVRDHPAALPTMRSARHRGLAIVLEVNGLYDELKLAYPWTRAFTPFLKWSFFERVRLADAVIVVTDRGRDSLRASGVAQEITVIPNAADPGRFTPAVAEHSIHSRRYAALVGALAVWQGVDTLLDALTDPAWPEDLDLVIAGAGREEERILSARESDGRITYLGQVPYADVPAILAGSIVSLSPKTDLSGLSGGASAVKLYESMACGVPVVVTDLPGQEEVVRTHDCGLVVPSADPKALAEAVAWIAEHPAEAKAMGERGRRAVVEQHSWAARAADTAEVLREAMLRRARGAER